MRGVGDVENEDGISGAVYHRVVGEPAVIPRVEVICFVNALLIEAGRDSVPTGLRGKIGVPRNKVVSEIVLRVRTAKVVDANGVDWFSFTDVLAIACRCFVAVTASVIGVHPVA